MRGFLLLALAVSGGLLIGPLLADDSSISLIVLNSMERALHHESPSGAPAAEIAGARNEVESFQVVVAALNGNIRVTRAGLSELVGDGGAKIPADNIRLYREEYQLKDLARLVCGLLAASNHDLHLVSW